MNADITLRDVEPDLIPQAEELFARIGLTMSEAIKYFLRASLKYDYLPPGIEEANFNEEMLAALQEAEDIASGKVQAKAYDSIEEMVRDIMAGDDDA